MKNKKAEVKKAIKKTSGVNEINKSDLKITLENHKKAADHHMQAANYHLEAAKNHEDGHHEKAAQNTVLAYGHHAIAGEYQSDDAKHHSQVLKRVKSHA